MKRGLHIVDIAAKRLLKIVGRQRSGCAEAGRATVVGADARLGRRSGGACGHRAARWHKGITP
jgi:hypothetical protein